MKFLISVTILTLFFSINTSALEDNKNFEKDVRDYIEGKTDVRPELLKLGNSIDDKKLRELLDKADSRNKTTFSVEKLKPFIVPLLVVLYLIFRSDSETKDKPKKNTKTRKNQSRNEEFIKKHNTDNNKDEMSENFNDFFEINNNKQYEDEWNYNDEESDFLQIRVEKRHVENIEVFDLMAVGILGFTKEQIDLTKNENEEAKFTCYVFDVTDDNNEIPLQGLTDPFKDENYLLASFRSMKVGLGFAYNEWTPMFRFPKTLVVPPNRGERKLKFVIYTTKLKAKFEKGKIKNKKDLYFETIATFDLNYEEPGYLDSEKYEGDLNEKIVQLGMAVAYSEKKINLDGIEAIKNWINSEIIWKDYLLDETEQKIKYSFLLKNTYELLKKNKLSLSEIVKEINFKSNISRRYDAMNLLLNIAGSDDRLSKEEDKLLNNTARALELDLNRFQQMKTSTIANIETIDESDDNEETVFNFSKDMTSEGKCKKLREEYTRWNRQTNNSNEKIRNQARKMVELTANLRKKYNC